MHGGYVAAAFDEVLGFANSLSGTPGMTGTLTVRYRRPTPLHTELRFEGRYERSEGRKIFTDGQLFAGGRALRRGRGPVHRGRRPERFRARRRSKREEAVR